MSKNIDDLKVGDTVWWTDVNRKGMHQGVVSKVGRKLVTVGRNLVFRKDSGRANDAYGHQKLVVDVPAYQDRQLAWKLYLQLRTTPMREGTTAATVMEAMKLLGIEPEAGSPQERREG